MGMLTLLVLLATAATVVSLVSGISSMATGGEVGHRNSAQWMVMRVVFQALALLLIVMGLLAR